MTCGGIETNVNQTYQINTTEDMSCGSNSPDYTNYYRYLDSHIPTLATAEKIIHVNIIVWQEDNNIPVTNWQDTPLHRAKLTHIIDLANAHWLNATPNPSDPISGVTEIPNNDKRYHMKLEGIYFIENSTRANSSGFGDKITYLQQNHPELLSQLNINIINRKHSVNGASGWSNGSKAEYPMVVTSDDDKGSGYNCVPTSTSSNCPMSIAEFPVGNYYRIWNFAHHISHEVSHNVDLEHVYTQAIGGGYEACTITDIDYMDDLFPQNAPYCTIPPSGCDVCVQQMTVRPQGYTGPDYSTTDGWTNNLMNGAEGNYLTPKQAGKVHRAFALHNIGSVTSGYSETPLEITQNETWDFKMQLYRSLVIKSGNTLTLKCKLLMPEQGSIIVETGAKLIIDGGVITKSNVNAGNSWQGILVYGNSNLPQTAANQGTVEIINQGTIEHAVTGITNANFNSNGIVWGTTGGIIHATEANFLNNNRDVQLLAYHRYFGNIEMPYNAYFEKCTFERNSDFAQDNITASISMWEVNGVRVQGCTFINEGNIGSVNLEHHKDSYAIYAIGAQLNVNEYHPPLSNIHDANTFEGYNYGIHATNVCRADKFAIIANSEFRNNAHGIYLHSHANARVLKNTIEVPADADIAFGSPEAYGVYFDASTGYHFQENEIERTGSGASTYGALFNNNGADNNLVYKNSFDGLFNGTQAIGNNKGNASGLEFQCNRYGDNTANTKDIAVYQAINPIGPQGIDANQGEYDPFIADPKALANNLLSNSGTDIDNDADVFTYNYGTGDVRFAPTNPTGIINQPRLVAVSFEEDCKSKLNSGIGPIDDPSGLQLELSQWDGQLSGKRALYSQLLNGGNTPELEAEILLAGQAEYQALYIELISISPHVDVAQLIDLINNTGFAELALRNVLVANPHASRSAEVMEVLEGRVPAVSQQTITDVLNTQQTFTSKDVLEAQMSTLNKYIASAVGDLQYYYAIDETHQDATDLELLFAGREEARYFYMLADYYLYKGESTKLTNHLNNANTEWWGEAEREAQPELQSAYTTLNSALENGEGIGNLSQSTLTSLQTQYNTTSIAMVKHRLHGWLKAANMHDNTYVEPVYSAAANKTAPLSTRPAKTESQVELFPNPAKDYVELRWNWFELGLDNTFTIEIVGLDGKVVMANEIKNFKNNISILNTSELKTGMYIVQMITNSGEIVYTQKLTVNH